MYEYTVFTTFVESCMNVQYSLCESHMNVQYSLSLWESQHECQVFTVFVMSYMNAQYSLGDHLSFSLAVIEPIPKGESAKDYLSRFVNPTLLAGLTELCKWKPADPFVSDLHDFYLSLYLYLQPSRFKFNHSFPFRLFPLLRKTWLADWLVENNPNKPKVSDIRTTEETE